MQDTAVVERTDRLAAARDAFGTEVRLSEPYSGRPPLLVEPASERLRTDVAAAIDWMARRHDATEQAMLIFGAVLLRGFPVEETDDFARLMGSFEVYGKGYTAGTSEREVVKGPVMEATRTPPDIYILLHQEMSYLPDNPRALAFWCNTPPASGGETVICDMRGLLEALPDALGRKFIENGIRYVRNMRNEDVPDWRADPVHSHPSWQHRFATTDRAVVEEKLRERGADLQWEPDGSVTFWTELPGITQHPITGELLFFNQMVAQTKHRVMFGGDQANVVEGPYGDRFVRPHFITFANGEPLTDDEFMTIHHEHERRKVAFPWQRRDVLILENKFTAHGRHPFSGPRDIQVMLLQ